MAVRNFTLYDLLADIVPGSLTIVFASVLYDFSSEPLSESGFIAGAAFFVLAYFIGRIIHTIGSMFDPCFRMAYKCTLEIRNFVCNITDKILCNNEGDGSSESEGSSETKYRINKLLSESSHRSSLEEEKLPKEISPKILEDIDRQLRRGLGSQYTGKQAKRYGEALIYKETTLYSKYEALVTFFRSIFLMPFILLVSPVILPKLELLDITLSFEMLPIQNLGGLSKLEISTIVLLVSTLPLSIYGGIKFWKARNVAFINDLHITLTQKADE